MRTPSYTQEQYDSKFEQFRDNLQLKVKDSGSSLRDKTDVETGYKGEQARPVSYLDVPDAREEDDPYGDTPIMGHSKTDRWISPKKIEWGDLITSGEVIESMSDPTSKIMQGARRAMRRGERFKIVEPAFFGTAYGGRDGKTPIAFPTDNVMDLGSSAAEKAFTYEKAKMITQMFYDNEVLLDEDEADDDPIFVGIGSQENSSIIDFAKVNAENHIEKPILKNGLVQSWMGLNFVHGKWGDKAGVRKLPAWKKSGMHIGIWEEIDGWLRPDTSKKGNPRLYFYGLIGATRLEEKKVLQVQTEYAQ